MTTPEEQELGRVLREHAASIDRAPAYRTEPEATLTRRGRRKGRSSFSRRTWTALVSGAAVAAMVTAGMVGARLGLLGERHPSVLAANCAAHGSGRFGAALRSGALPVGDVVLAGSHDGNLLVAVEHDGRTTAVEAQSPGGAVSRLWTARSADHVRAVANPSGAINAEWATFVLVPMDGTNAPVVLVADRSANTVATLRLDAGYRVSTDPRSAPIAMSDSVDLIEVSIAEPWVQQLAQYWVDTTLRAATGHTRTSGVTTLLAVGGNVVTIRTQRHGSVAIDFDQQRYRPWTLLPAARHGYSFASDDTTLTWLSADGGQHNLWQWTPGDPAPVRHAVPHDVRSSAAAGRFAVSEPATARGRQLLVDSRTGRVIGLPPGVTLVDVNGSVAVLAIGTSATVRYARIPVAALDSC